MTILPFIVLLLVGRQLQTVDAGVDCNGVFYDPYSATCCNGVIDYDHAFLHYYNSLLRYADCCGTVAYDYFSDVCCDGVLTTGVSYLDILDGTGACCGTTGILYDSAICCDGVVVSGNTCSATGTSTPATGSGSGNNGGGLEFTCYANDTIKVTNPDQSVFSHVMAVQQQGLSTATKCTVSTSSDTVLITGCPKDVETTVFFSDRANGDNDLFVGQTTRSFSIKCDEIVDTGIARTVSKQLGATLETSTEEDVTPSFTVTTELRTVSQTGSSVSVADVGDTVYWTIDIPGDYYAKPTCTAYSGTDNTGTAKEMFNAGCASDDDLAAADFTSTTTLGLLKRYWTTIYVFKFYDSNDVYFHCTVLLCPADGSSNCNAGCSRRKRSFVNITVPDTARYFEASKSLHIAAAQGSGATAILGGVMSLAVIVAMVM